MARNVPDRLEVRRQKRFVPAVELSDPGSRGGRCIPAGPKNLSETAVSECGRLELRAALDGERQVIEIDWGKLTNADNLNRRQRRLFLYYSLGKLVFGTPELIVRTESVRPMQPRRSPCPRRTGRSLATSCLPRSHRRCGPDLRRNNTRFRSSRPFSPFRECERASRARVPSPG